MAGPVTRDTSTLALGLAQIRVGKSALNIATATPVLSASDSIGAMASTKLSSTVTYFKHESGFPANEDLSVPLKEVCELECAFEEMTPFNLALARGLDPKPSATKSGTMGGTFDVSKVTFGQGAVAGKTYTLTFSSATAYAVTSSGVTFDVSTASGTVSTTLNALVGGVVVLSIPATAFSGTFATGNTVVLTVTGYPQNHVGTIGLGNMNNAADIRMEAVYTYPNGINTMTIIFPRAQVEASPSVQFQKDKNLDVTIKFVSKDASSGNSAGNAAWDNMPQGHIIFA